MDAKVDKNQTEKIIKLDNQIFYMGKELGKLETTVNKGFEKLEKKIDSLDDRYASKNIEIEVSEMKKKQEQRNYDWLKQLAITLLGVILAIGVYSNIG